MLKKENRLRDRKIFEEVLKKGKTFRTKNLFFKILKSADPNELKFGFVVSLKISKKAVKRNKLKRRMREIVRQEIPKLKKGFWGIFLPQRSALELNFWDLKKEIVEIFQKANLYG